MAENQTKHTYLTAEQLARAEAADRARTALGSRGGVLSASPSFNGTASDLVYVAQWILDGIDQSPPPLDWLEPQPFAAEPKPCEKCHEKENQ